MPVLDPGSWAARRDPGVYMGTRLEPPGNLPAGTVGARGVIDPNLPSANRGQKTHQPFTFGFKARKVARLHRRAGERILPATLSNWNMTGIFIRQRQMSKEDRNTFPATSFLHKQSYMFPQGIIIGNGWHFSLIINPIRMPMLDMELQTRNVQYMYMYIYKNIDINLYSLLKWILH